MIWCIKCMVTYINVYIIIYKVWLQISGLDNLLWVLLEYLLGQW